MLLHIVDKVLCPFEKNDNPCCQEQAYIKKFFKGDDILDIKQIILGWIIGTVNGTIELSPQFMAKYV